LGPSPSGGGYDGRVTDVARKLRLGPGQRLLVIQAPPTIEALLGPLPAGASFSFADPSPDLTLLFATDLASLERHLPEAARVAAGDGMLWVAYPKRGGRVASDLDRDGLTAATERLAALTGVALISLDATWSAMRLRPSARYGR
jgi:hypothetical protein